MRHHNERNTPLHTLPPLPVGGHEIHYFYVVDTSDLLNRIQNFRVCARKAVFTDNEWEIFEEGVEHRVGTDRGWLGTHMWQNAFVTRAQANKYARERLHEHFKDLKDGFAKLVAVVQRLECEDALQEIPTHDVVYALHPKMAVAALHFAESECAAATSELAQIRAWLRLGPHENLLKAMQQAQGWEQASEGSWSDARARLAKAEAELARRNS